MSDELTAPLYRTEQIREFDRVAIDDLGIAGTLLMKRAGRAAFELLRECWPEESPITVFCGAGNNAGDGYVVAALAAEQCIPVQVAQVGDLDKLQGDAKRAYQYAVDAGVPIITDWQTLSTNDGVIVDALLGAGLNGAVREPFSSAIAKINQSQLPVLSVDIPSGLCGDTGAELGVAVQADAVVSYIGLKQGLYTGRGPALAGEVFFDSLDVPEDVYRLAKPSAQLLNLCDLLGNLEPRPQDAHKGMFGHVMVIGGDHGMGGAAAMAAEAAFRSGAGLVSVATRPEHVSGILARRPELMVSGVVSGQELEPLLEKPSVLVVGPGLGNSPWSEQMLQQAIKTGLPMVLDADALNILSQGRITLSDKERSLIITPHPGEAARLLSVTTSDIQADRFVAARKLSDNFNGVAVLKGAGSLIAAPDSEIIGICSAGNPGMASGGMGDVLSGVLGALLAQGLPAATAAQLGTCLHAEAADIAAELRGERGLLATDLMEPLQHLVNSGDELYGD